MEHYTQHLTIHSSDPLFPQIAELMRTRAAEMSNNNNNNNPNGQTAAMETDEHTTVPEAPDANNNGNRGSTKVAHNGIDPITGQLAGSDFQRVISSLNQVNNNLMLLAQINAGTHQPNLMDPTHPTLMHPTQTQPNLMDPTHPTLMHPTQTQPNLMDSTQMQPSRRDSTQVQPPPPWMHPHQGQPTQMQPSQVHQTPHPVYPTHSGQQSRHSLITLKAKFTKGGEQLNEDGIRAILIHNLEIIKQHPRSNNFPMELLHTFLEDLTLVAFVQPRLATWRAELHSERTVPLHHSPNPLTGLSPYEEAFIRDVIHFIGGEVRPMDVVALAELHEGKVTQTSTTAHYAQAFKARARVLPNESQQSLCLLYLKGLKPYIQKHCTHDHNNGRWKSLQDLIDYSHVMEEKADSLFKFNHHKQGQNRDNGNGNNHRKRPAAAADTPTLAAATITPPKAAEHNREPRWQAPGPLKPLSNFEDCRLWVNPAKKPDKLPTLTNADKTELYRYGLCFCCRQGPHWEKEGWGKNHPDCDFNPRHKHKKANHGTGGSGQ
jgi:hypothetical protein